MMLCCWSVCKRRSAERAHAGHCHRRGVQLSSTRSCQVSGVHLVRHSSTSLEGRFWRISSPLPLRAQACDPQAGQFDFSVSLSRIALFSFCEGPNITFEWLGKRGHSWAVRRPSVIMARIRPPRPEDRSRHLVMSVCHHKESALPSSSPPTASASAPTRLAPNPASDSPPWYGDLLQLLPFPGSGHL